MITTINQAAIEVVNLLHIFQGKGSHYFNVQINGELIKIRVSDHTANKSNNKGLKTISFVTGWCNQGYNSMVDEYCINMDGTMNENWENVEECLLYIL